MTVSLGENAIRLIGACGVEEVEPLVSYLESRPELAVDITTATTIHTALWQALMVFRPNIVFPSVSASKTDKVLEALAIFLQENREP